MGSDLRRSAWWWIRTAAIVATVLAGYEILIILGGFVSAVFNVVLYIVFGAIVAFLLGPAANFLARRLGMPRTLAVLLVLFGALSVIGLGIYLAASPTASEAKTLADQVPGFIARANDKLATLRNQLHAKGIDVSALDLSGNSSDFTNRVQEILLKSITGTLTALADVVIVIVVAFWLMRDGDVLRERLLGILPGRLRVNVEFALDAFGVVIGGYVRAQLLLALIIGAMAGIGCALLGVPFPIVVALAAFIFELIPIVGPFVGGAVAILLALTVSFTLALLTLVLFIGIHIVEGYILGPRIQAKFVQLHPLISLLALFTGIELGGFLGALFAVPIASLAAVFLRAAVGDIRASRPELFTVPRADMRTERRRQRILGEFRLFKRSPWAIIAARVRHPLETAAPEHAGTPTEVAKPAASEHRRPQGREAD
jgi:predicted PurR-regulated permease PerM